MFNYYLSYSMKDVVFFIGDANAGKSTAVRHIVGSARARRMNLCRSGQDPTQPREQRYSVKVYAQHQSEQEREVNDARDPIQLQIAYATIDVDRRTTSDFYIIPLRGYDIPGHNLYPNRPVSLPHAVEYVREFYSQTWSCRAVVFGSYPDIRTILPARRVLIVPTLRQENQHSSYIAAKIRRFLSLL